MDGSHHRQRSRPPYPRAPSRSSSHTANPRMTPQSTNSSSSHIAASPQQTSTHLPHRYHHSSCATSTSSPRPMSRLGPQLSRQGSSESARQPALSSFLQEKLQKERQAECEKNTHHHHHPFTLSRAHTDMSMSLDMGHATQDSPFRTADMESNRPQSSAGADPGQKPMGAKERETAMSTLHKKNFDLKLELFHRRERQTKMEERLETLESNKTQMEDMNDKLLAELEKRDKAVEEAVAMIVTLEAKVEQYVKEREMVQQVENELFCPSDFEKGYRNAAHQPSGAEPAKSESDNNRTLNRMPSFLSERSENTENLRNVYLGARGSVLSLGVVAEGSPDADNGHVNGLASPTLSVLSESSFVSVYGQRTDDGQPPPSVDEPLTLDGFDGHPRDDTEHTAKLSKGRSTVRPTTASSSSRPSQFQSLSGVIGQGSPLQRIERLDYGYPNRKDGSRPHSRSREMDRRPSSSSARSTVHKPTKQEKREALRRVMTDAPGGVRLHDQGLPPTPDTISTSTLRRFKNSNDTLSGKQDSVHEQSQGASLHSRPSGDALPEPQSGASLGNMYPPNNSFSKARDVSGSSTYSQRGAFLQRPRSAGESTVSNRRGNDWDSDGDDSDAHSLESSLDIWMREGSQPTKRDDRSTPDLFSFPTNASRGGWAPDSMFGPNSAQTGGAGVNLEKNYMHDLFSVRQGYSGNNAPPPPPHRRSSLHAQTGPNEHLMTSSIHPALTDAWQRSPDRRRTRRNSEDPYTRDDLKTPVQTQPLPPPSSDQKRNHYPPITGQHAPRTGLNRLFRRSLGSSSTPEPPPSASQTPAPNPAHEPALADIPKGGLPPGMGMPSWVNRSCAIDDERTGATPPPITFNPRHGRRNTSVEVPAATAAAMEQGRSASASFGAGVGKGGEGSRRKWLGGFGRARELRRN